MTTAVAPTLARDTGRPCMFAAAAGPAMGIWRTGTRSIVIGAQPSQGCEALDSFLREDWEYRLIETFAPAASNWYHRNGGAQLFQIDGMDLAEAGRFSFLTRVILEKGRTLVALSDAIEALAPSEIYCDATLAPYLLVLFEGPLQVIGQNTDECNDTTGNATNAASICRESLLGLGYKLAAAVATASWLQYRQGAPLADAEPWFVGSEHGLKNLEFFFRQCARRVHVLRPAGQLSRNRGLAGCDIDWHTTYLEALLAPADLARVTAHALQVARWFARTARCNGFSKLLMWKGRDSLALFAPEFARFVLAHSVGAFRNHYLALRTLDRHHPARVFFDNANAWEFSVIAEHCRRKAIPTVGFVNGLVQDIIPFRCGVDTLLTSGQWDRDLLQPLFPRTDVVAYGDAKRAELTANERRNLLIVSSSCRDHGNRRVFVRVVAEYIERYVHDGDFNEIVLKLHPYEDREQMRSYFAEFPTAAARIRITRLGLEEELRRSRVAICLLSTVLRDLARDGTPCLLFDSIEWPRHTFYAAIPQAMKFTTVEELAIRAADLDALRQQSLLLRRLYFGDPAPQPELLLRQHLYGEKG